MDRSGSVTACNALPRSLSLALVLALGLLCSCSADDKPQTGTCPHEAPGGTCAGVTHPEICSGKYCTSGASCTKVWYVDANARSSSGNGSEGSPLAALEQAAAKASAGQCIALAAGTYTGSGLKGGVSLLGTGSKSVTIKSPNGALALAVFDGKGGMLRGFALSSEGAGLALQDVEGTRIEQVKIAAAKGVGVDLRRSKDVVFEHVQVQAVITQKAPEPDSGPDQGPDAGIPDATLPDTVTQPDVTTADAGMEAGTKAGMEAGMADAGMDDAGSEAGQDSGADSIPAADSALPDSALPDSAPPMPDSGQDGSSGDSAVDAGSGQQPQQDTGFGIGLLAAEESTVELTGCAVENAGTQGVLIHGSSVTLEGSVIVSSGLFGVAIDCSSGCQGVPGSTISNTTIANSKAIGLLVIGGKLSALNNDIGHTTYKAGAARCVQVQQGAEVTFDGNKIHNSQGQGFVVDNSTGKLLKNKIEANEERGVWIQHVSKGSGLLLESNEVVSNEHAGVGVLSSTGVTIKGGRIADTKKRSVMVDATYDEVGDGVQVLLKSEVTLSETSVDGNERVGVIIDEATAIVKDTTISGGKEQLVVQNAKVEDQSFTNVTVTGSTGTAVKPTVPSQPFLVNKAALVSILPIPIPQPAKKQTP